MLLIFTIQGGLNCYANVLWGDTLIHFEQKMVWNGGGGVYFQYTTKIQGFLKHAFGKVVITCID